MEACSFREKKGRKLLSTNQSHHRTLASRAKKMMGKIIHTSLRKQLEVEHDGRNHLHQLTLAIRGRK